MTDKPSITVCPFETSLIEKLEALKVPLEGSLINGVQHEVIDNCIAIVRQHEAAQVSDCKAAFERDTALEWNQNGSEYAQDHFVGGWKAAIAAMGSVCQPRQSDMGDAKSDEDRMPVGSIPTIPPQQREISVVDHDLRQAWGRIRDAMEYYAKVALYAIESSGEAGGIAKRQEVGYLATNCAPDVKKVDAFMRTTEPVSVHRCIIAAAAADKEPLNGYRAIVKSVLDAAGGELA